MTKRLHIKILVLFLIMANYSIGQGTLTVANGGKIQISSGTSVQNQNLNIGSGSQLINWGDLTVNGVLANNAGTLGLIMKADESGYGSLMHSTALVPATVEQYLSSEKWHLVAPGLSIETIEPYLDIYFKTWHENDGTWEYLTQPLSIEIFPTMGYSAWSSDATTGNTTINLEGNLLSGDTPATNLYYTSTSPMDGWNLLGNPYPSTVDWNGTWQTTNIGGWALIYDNGTYKGWNPFLTGNDRSYNGKTDGMIAPKQGFWIRATGANPTLVFEQDARSHGKIPFYKYEEVIQSYPSLHLIAEANGFTDEMAVLFLEGGTIGFDGLYELEKHFNVIEAPTIYSMPATEVPTAFNVLPGNWIKETKQPVIPVGFELDEGVPCTISSTGLETFDPYTTLYLEDLVEDIMHDLYMGDYSFISGNPENPNRFLLHFDNPEMGEENALNSIQIYSYNEFVYVKTPINTQGKAVVYDIMGREVTSFVLEDGLTKKPLYKSGYYIVKVISSGQLTTNKVYIKQL